MKAIYFVLALLMVCLLFGCAAHNSLAISGAECPHGQARDEDGQCRAIKMCEDRNDCARLQPPKAEGHWGCQDSQCTWLTGPPPVQAEMPMIEVGITRIEQVYGYDDNNLVALFRTSTSTAFVSTAKMEQVIKSLQPTIEGSTWVVPFAGGQHTFNVVSLATLDFGQAFQANDWITVSGWWCEIVDPGKCIEIIDANTKKTKFSFLSPDTGTAICTEADPDDTCTYQLRNLPIDKFPNADCTPPSAPANEDLWICEDNSA
jgi:hypothetical protein